MKINGPNQSNFNPYKNQMHTLANVKKEQKQKDQLEISSQAKQLLENIKPQDERARKVDEIKEKVEAGEYQVNYEKTAQKMIAFWSNK